MSAPRTSIGRKRAVIVAALLWAAALSLIVSALGIVLGLLIGVWGGSIVALAVLYRLDTSSSRQVTPVAHQGSITAPEGMSMSADLAAAG